MPREMFRLQALHLNVTTSDVQLTYCTTKGNNVYYEWIDLVQDWTLLIILLAANGGYADFTNLSTSLALGETVLPLT